MGKVGKCTRVVLGVAGFATALLPTFAVANGATAVVATQPVPGSAAATVHETEAQTIAKCLRDLQDQSVDVRRRAIYVLGKYRTPQASAGMIRALQDADAVVRQSALVSLAEQTRIPASAALPILRLLQDPDVHIRRIASTALPAVAAELARQLRKSGPPAEEISRLVNETLRGQESGLRQDLLRLAHVFRSVIDPASLQACLEAQDPEVRRQGVHAASLTLPGPIFLNLVMPLTGDSDARVRRELVQALPRSGKDALPVLRKLADDPEPAVSTQALRGLAQFGDPDVLSLLRRMLADKKSTPPEEVAQILSFLPRYGEPGLALLKDLVASEGPGQATALRSLAYADRNIPAEFFLPFCNSPDRKLRQAAGNALMVRGSQLDSRDIKRLCTSSHVDMRVVSLRLLRYLPQEDAQDALLDLLLDEDVGVRCGAIGEVCRRGGPEWALFMRQSLKDPAVEIRLASIKALMRRNDATSRQILTDFQAESRDPRLKAMVSQFLRKPVRRKSNPRVKPVK
jgi:HEAT repeat protein